MQLNPNFCCDWSLLLSLTTVPVVIRLSAKSYATYRWPEILLVIRYICLVVVVLKFPKIIGLGLQLLLRLVMVVIKNQPSYPVLGLLKMLDVTREWSTLSLAFIFSWILLSLLTQIDWFKMNYRSIFPDHRGAGEWRSSNHGSAGGLAMQWNHTNRKPLKCIWAWSLSL